MNPAIVTVGVGNPFNALVQRVKTHVRKHQPDVPVLSWADEYPEGSPSHQESPYAFKFFAFDEARKRGHDVILWVDSRVYPLQPFRKLLEYIEDVGHYFHPNGWNVGQWCKDEALKTLGIEREEAFNIPDVMGGFFGLDLRRELSREFLARMKNYALDGVTFPGPWSNRNAEASNDWRVLGHRHDQTAMSVERVRLGMDWRLSEDDSWFFYPSKGQTAPPQALFTL